MPWMSSAAVLAALAVGPTPVGYTLDATWSPSARTLSGTESIALRNDQAAALTNVWVRLWPNNSVPGEADGCRKPRASISMLGGGTIARYAAACSAARIRLSEPLARGAAATLAIRFAVRVPTQAAQFGRSAGIDLIGRAVPVLAVHDRGGWHLNPDTDTGDPTYSLTAPWHATIRIPAADALASTGAEVANTVDAGTRTITVASAHARDFGLAIGPMRQLSATADGARVRVFASTRGTDGPMRATLGSALAALRAYTRWYGPYGSPELDLVITNLGFNSQEFPELVFTDPDRATVSHEVAHQWFYGIVGDDQYTEPWLDESFAAWSEEQLAPGQYPCDVRRPLGAHPGGLARGLAYYETRGDEYVDVIYRGGSCALTALERMLGPRRFLGLLRTEVARYRYGIVDTHAFIALLARTSTAVARRWTALVGLPYP